MTSGTLARGAAMSARSRPARAELLIVVCVGLAAFLFTQWYLQAYRAGGGVPRFYQNEFAPAVMLRCGRGFVNVDLTLAPRFAAFLSQQADSLQCGDVPAAIRTQPMNGFQGITRYLMTAASLVWRVSGINWRSLDVLTAAFVAATVAAAYLALRFVCGRTVSLLLTFFWAVSPRHLENVPHLRDYSKAPFFMFLLIAMGVAFVERRPWRLLALGVVFGAVQGLGFGMRTDVALNFVPFFIVLFAGSSDGMLRNLKAKVACAAAAVALFAVVSYPVLQTYGRNISMWHVALLGFTSPYDENLDIGFPRPSYSYPYAHNDGYIDAVVRSYWGRLHPGEPSLVMLSRPYDRACEAYFWVLARMFPGDMLTRAVASVFRVLNFPFWQPEGHVPVGITNRALAGLWEGRASLMQTLDGAGPLLIAAVVVLVGMDQLRLACIAFLLVWIWAAYPVIEFQWRHIFQFELLVLTAMACGCSLLWRELRRAAGGAVGDVATRGARSIALVVGLLAAVGAAVAVARVVQVPRARALLASYASAALEPLPAAVVPLPDGRVRLAADPFASAPAANEALVAMIAADFTAGRCRQPALVDATFRYQESDPRFALDFSRPMTVPLSPASGPPTRVFFPAYAINRGENNGSSRFVGVEVAAGNEDCVRLWRVRDISAFPVVLSATLTSDWQDKLYQRLRFERLLKR